MKINLLITIWILAATSYCVSASQCNPPDREECINLADAIWKNTPQNIDAAYNKKTFRKPLSEQEIRKKYEDVLIRMYGPKDQMDEQKQKDFERQVELNVSNIMTEQTEGVNVRKRIRLSGSQERTDQTTSGPDGQTADTQMSESGLRRTYDVTSIISGGKRIICQHATKMMEIWEWKGKELPNSDIDDIVSQHINWLLSDRQKGPDGFVYAPSTEKLESLIKNGAVNNIRVMICSEADAPWRKRIEIKDVNGLQLVNLICDSANYSLTYYTEVFMPHTEKPIYIRECNNFDSQGTPKNITVTEYELDGSFREKEVYEIMDVNLDAVITSDVFEFSPPKEYSIVEIDANGTRRVVREQGGIEGEMVILMKAANSGDTGTLIGMLDSHIWQIRLRSLRLLNMMMKEDREGVKAIAQRLADDPNESVRKEAAKILNRLGTSTDPSKH